MTRNVNETIGCEYEIIAVDNSKNDKTIFQAYNEGISRAKGDILCFMHEDIEFLSEGWGKKVYSHFEDNSLGLLGVVGGHCLPSCPCSWWSAGINSGRIWQGRKLEEYAAYLKESETAVQVAAVDGLWMCIPRVLFDNICFDDNTFKGFHSYDTDICMQVTSIGYEIRVAFDINIRHNSNGAINRQYFDARDTFYQKWKDSLPIVKGVVLRDNELEERLSMVQRFNESEEALLRLSEVYDSKAYKIGKSLTRSVKKLIGQK